MNRTLAASLAVLIALFLVADHTRGQSPRHGDPAASAEISQFWDRWESQRPSEAIRLATTNTDLQRAWEQIGRTADEYQARTGGKCLGHSQITRKPLGDRMQYISFFALYDPSPMRVQMLYYRPRDAWTLLSIRVDFNPARWLEEQNQPQVTESQQQQ